MRNKAREESMAYGAPVRRVRSRPASPTRLAWTFALILLMVVEIGFFAYYRDNVQFELPRDGEAYVSDDALLDCLANLIEMKGEGIPFLINTVTMEYLDMKTYFCTLTVPVQYVMIVVSGDFPPFIRLGNKIRARFAYTDRIQVSLRPENPGYAASMNEGLRAAAQHPPSVVPWVMLTNSDVRYGDDFWPTFLANVNAQAARDQARLSELQAEVAAETASPFPRGYGDGTNSAVGANLLPDRIRRLPPEALRTTFASHVGLFFALHHPHMCTFVTTRLHLDAVGYFDENHYPLYGEDHDWHWRSQALGFTMSVSAPNKIVHFSNANLKTLKEDRHGRVAAPQRAMERLSASIRRMGNDYFRNEYRKLKWFATDAALGIPGKYRAAVPFNGTIPVDVWVRDAARIASIRDIGANRKSASGYLKYNPALLLPYNMSLV